MGLSAWVFLPKHRGLFQDAVWTLAAALIAVYWIKGEKPGWRWGKD